MALKTSSLLFSSRIRSVFVVGIAVENLENIPSASMDRSTLNGESVGLCQGNLSLLRRSLMAWKRLCRVDADEVPNC